MCAAEQVSRYDVGAEGRSSTNEYFKTNGIKAYIENDEKKNDNNIPSASSS